MSTTSGRKHIWYRLRQFSHFLKEDWRGTRSVTLGLALLLFSSLVVTAYYLNHPTPDVFPDTPSYLKVAQQITTSGKLVDSLRTPGYPLLIAVVFLVAGQGNLAAVSIVQGILFVAAVLEIYSITCLVTRRTWIALLVGLVMASNTYLLTFIKPILSEGVSLWVVASLALALVLFIRTLRVRHLWFVAVCLLVAFMTRPEWVYGPILLFAFLLLVAARHGRFRRLAPHAIGAVLILYGVLGFYIYENATLNGYAGVSYVQRINLLGKVLQYNMQNEAPPQYATLSQVASAYRATGAISPFGLAELYPPVATNHWALADAYATSVVEHHPIEYGLKTLSLLFSSSSEFYEQSRLDMQGPFGNSLSVLARLSRETLLLYQFFPVFALMWLGLLFWRRAARTRTVEMMGAFSLVGLYELVIISAGTYGAYARLHAPFDPIMLVVICGSLLLGLSFLVRLLKNPSLVSSALIWLWPRIWWVWGGIVLGGIVASAILTLLREGLAALAHPRAWVGFSFVFYRPTGPCIALALLALTYFSYQAHRRQASGSRAGKGVHMSSPEYDEGYPDEPGGLLPEETLLARQPEREGSTNERADDGP